MTANKFDKFGFPLLECERCLGSGEHSFHIMAGNRCFDCGGSGLVRTKQGRREYLKWLQAVHAFRETPLAKVLVGDKISIQKNHQSQRNEWGTVLEIEHTVLSADEKPFSSSHENGVLVHESRERWMFTVKLKCGHQGGYCFDRETMVQVSRGTENEPKPDEFIARSLSAKVRK